MSSHHGRFSARSFFVEALNAPTHSALETIRNAQHLENGLTNSKAETKQLVRTHEDGGTSMKAIFAHSGPAREVWDRVKAKFLRRTDSPHALSLHLLEAPEPSLIDSNWVKVRTIVSGISDLDEGVMLHHDMSSLGQFLPLPFVPGNENVGIVTEVGPNVSGIEIGERVVVNPLLSCKTRGIAPPCPSCSRGEPSSCANFTEGTVSPGTVIGGCRDTGGGWSDSFVAHASQVRRLPQNLDTDHAVLIPEFARALRAVLQHPPQQEDRVLVIGASSLGLLILHAISMLRLKPNMLTVAEHSFEADVARKLSGRQVVLTGDHGTLYDAVADFARGAVRYQENGSLTLAGGADLVYETTGTRHNVDDALRFTREGKKVVLAGIRHTSGFDMTPLWFKGIRVHGTAFSGQESYRNEQRETFDIAVDLVADRGLPFSDIVTHKFKLDEYHRALEVLADRGHTKAIKAIFQHVV
jgi:threonine dehydrogenase-like Zn-dependent dehydrogenase